MHSNISIPTISPIPFSTALAPPQRWGTDQTQVWSHIPAAELHNFSFTELQIFSFTELQNFSFRIKRTGEWIYKSVSPFLVNPHSIQSQCSWVDSHFRKHFIPSLFWEDKLEEEQRPHQPPSLTAQIAPLLRPKFQLFADFVTLPEGFYTTSFFHGNKATFLFKGSR